MGNGQWSDIRNTSAAIRQQVVEQGGHAVHICKIPDAAPLAVAMDQPGSRKDAEMRRNRVLPGLYSVGDFTRAHTIRARTHEQPENVDPRLMAQCRQRRDGRVFFHISRIIDTLIVRKQGVDADAMLA